MTDKPEPEKSEAETDAEVSQEPSAELLSLVYKELRALAASYMQRERVGHTLQATALVNEAYLRLVNIDKVDWQNKSHFFAVAARQMRRALVDHARARSADKRGGDQQPVTLDASVAIGPGHSVEVLALSEALDQLARLHARQSKVVELRFFAGLDVAETAKVLDVSERTVKKDWRMAKAWLLTMLEEGAP